MRKLWVSIITAALVFASLPASVAAGPVCDDDPVQAGCETPAPTPNSDEGFVIVIDGIPLNADPSPFIERGRILVPMRAIMEKLGATVEWNDDTRTAHAWLGDGYYDTWIQPGIMIAMNSGWNFRLDVPAKIVGDRIFLPLRFTAEALGATVKWNGQTRTAYIYSNTQYVPTDEELRAALDQTKPYMVPCGYYHRGAGPYDVLCATDELVSNASPAVFRHLWVHLETAKKLLDKIGVPPYEQSYSETEVAELLRLNGLPPWHLFLQLPPQPSK